MPAIEDPNTGLTLWESGAIYQYLAEQYDTADRVSYGTLNERHLCSEYHCSSIGLLHVPKRIALV